MARQPRIEVAGGYYHVFARGNERRALYRDTNDRTTFLELLGTTLEGYAWELLSYVLMTNHYHLLIQTNEPNLSAGMHYLNAVYAQRFNRRHRRVGHLYQGRYKARLVQDDERLLATIRYIVRNPVRASAPAQTSGAGAASARSSVSPHPDWSRQQPSSRASTPTARKHAASTAPSPTTTTAPAPPATRSSTATNPSPKTTYG